MSFIYKDYELANGTLFKKGMKTSHLLHTPPYSNSPAIDADNVWDKYSKDVERIVFMVEEKQGGKVFSIDKETFELRKQVIDFGFGRQYAMPLEFWRVANL